MWHHRSAAPTDARADNAWMALAFTSCLHHTVAAPVQQNSTVVIACSDLHSRWRLWSGHSYARDPRTLVGRTTA